MKNHCILIAAFAAALAVFCGCDSADDGSRDFADGKEAFEQGDLAKAARYFEQSAALMTTNADTFVYLARTRLGLGELADARVNIQKAEELAGGDADVRVLSAQLAWHAKDYDMAAKGFSAIANDAKVEAALRAEGWAGLGVVEMTRNNRDLARIAFLRAIRLDRRNASAWYNLGFLYRDNFNYLEAALEQFSIYVRLEETATPRVQKIQRTIIPELKESIARAAAERPGASRRDSAAAAAAIAKAESAWKKGNYKTARVSYQEALKADPLSYPAALGLAQAHLKTDATQKGQKNALEAYRQACMLKPGAISTFLAAADLAVRLGYHSAATEIYSRAVAADPSSLPALDGLIRALRRVGGKNSAAQAYQGYRDSLSAGKKK